MFLTEDQLISVRDTAYDRDMLVGPLPGMLYHLGDVCLSCTSSGKLILLPSIDSPGWPLTTWSFSGGLMVLEDGDVSSPFW